MNLRLKKYNIYLKKKRENFSIPGPSTKGCQHPPPTPHHQILRIDRKGMTDKMTSYRTTNDVINFVSKMLADSAQRI